MQFMKSIFLTNYFITMGFAFLTSMRTVSSIARGQRTRATASALFSRDALAEVDEHGEFKRRDAAWRNWISSEEGAIYSPEKDRYHLFVAYACPWAHRTLIVRALKGLQDVIPVTYVHPVWQRTKPDQDEHRGWIFGNPGGEPLKNTDGKGSFPPAYTNNEPNPLLETRSIRELYEKVEDTDGKYTVPILWDKKYGTIVNNESSEIIRMFNNEFNDFARNPELDLYPENLRDAIDSINEWVYPGINNGVYRCGFSTSQKAYDLAISELTEAFDRVNDILQKQRYIAGDQLTEADVRLFVTLLRYDEVYYVYFKTNTRSVANSPAILNYCRDIYQTPGVTETVDMEQIKAHYYCSHTELNTYSIIPRGPGFMNLLAEPHNREGM
jgi:putative glutathione S-transferase